MGVFPDTQPSGYLPLTPVATVQHFPVGQPRVHWAPAAVKSYKAPVLRGHDATYTQIELRCTAEPHVISAWRFRNPKAGLMHF